MGVEIPYGQLRPETLQALIEEFVTRHGAVHGHTETSLAQMVQQVRGQLKTGKAVILFDEETEGCTIVTVDHRKS